MATEDDLRSVREPDSSGAMVTSVAPPSSSPTVAPTFLPPEPAHSTRKRPNPVWMVAVGAAVLAGVIVVLLLGGGAGSSPEQAIAAAINLRASDLPGFTAQAPDHSGTGSQIDSRMRACVGSGWIAQHSGSQLADVSSPQFASGSGLQAEQVSSDVTIKRSVGAVRSDLATIESGRIQGCLAPALDGVTIPTRSGLPVTIGNVQVTQFAPSSAGSDGSFGIRTTMLMNAAGVNVPVVLDILGYAVGKDELGLITFGIGHPFSTPSEQQLSSLLITRALARPH